MQTLAEKLVQKFGIPIEKARKIVDRVVKDEEVRSLNPDVRREQLLKYNSRLPTPGLFVANEITRKPVR